MTLSACWMDCQRRPMTRSWTWYVPCMPSCRLLISCLPPSLTSTSQSCALSVSDWQTCPSAVALTEVRLLKSGLDLGRSIPQFWATMTALWCSSNTTGWHDGDIRHVQWPWHQWFDPTHHCLTDEMRRPPTWTNNDCEGWQTAARARLSMYLASSPRQSMSDSTQCRASQATQIQDEWDELNTVQR